MSWQPQRVDEITHVVTKGTTPTTLGRQFTDSGVNFIKAEALNGDSGLDFAGFSHVDDDTHEILSRSILQEDDVLVTIAGARVGKCGYVKAEHLPANTNQAVGIVRVNKEKAVPRFVYYFFKQPRTFALCQSLGGQAAQPNVNLTVLKSIAVPLPNIAIQSRIVDILSAYDDLIEYNRRRTILLEAAARQLYREWFIRLRFPGHEHTRIAQGMPAGWERKRLADLADVNRESLSGSFDGEIEYIDISSVTPGSINETAAYSFIDAPSRARRVVQHGDIIWSCVRPNRRSYAVIWQPAPNLIASTGFAVLTPRTVPTAFLLQACTTDDFVGYLENHARGAAYPAVVAGDFERVELLVPRALLIERFNEQTEPLLALANVLGLQNKRLRAARDLLLPRLMSGEIVI